MLPLVDAALDAALPPADAPPARLHAAMRHLIFPGGKRLRPALALAAAEAAGGEAAVALPAAVAVELVHTWSLVHDDLPCMDDDRERRGRPTVHVAYGEATAVLAGDALLAAAFAALVGPAGAPGAERRLAAAGELARAAGAAGLVGGQSDDLEVGSADAARIEDVHTRKTGALIAVSLTAGARLAGADESALARLGAAGRAAGVAFQIADDLLDAGASDGCSLVRALGADGARARADALVAQALGQLAGLGPAADALRELLRYTAARRV